MLESMGLSFIYHLFSGLKELILSAGDFKHLSFLIQRQYIILDLDIKFVPF